MKLDELRAQIDAIDTQLLKLLEQRINVVEQVGQLKQSTGLDGVYIKPKREETMMQRILQAGAGKFPKKALFSIWRSIISASLQVEQPFKVLTTANIGKEIYEYFGFVTEYVVLPSEEAVFAQISSKDVGVLPNTANFANLPKNMQIFAKFGNYSAFAQIKE